MIYQNIYYSKRDIPAANLDLHLSHCIKNLRLCTLCDDPIPIREFEDHIKEEHAEVCTDSVHDL